MHQAIVSFLAANPEAVYALCACVLWPLLTGMLSLGRGWLDAHVPTLAKALRASGFDLLGFLRVVVPGAPRSKAPPSSLVLCLVLALVGCTPAERGAAAGVSQVAVPICSAGMAIAAAPELVPICAAIPEIEAAIAALFADHPAAGRLPKWEELTPDQRAQVHRVIVQTRAFGGQK